MYHEGEYVKKDIKESIHLLTLSAEKNNVGASIKLGQIYFNEIPNINKSIYYFSQAANQNIPIIQYYLGFIYL